MYGYALLLLAALLGFIGMWWPSLVVIVLLLSIPSAGRILALSSRYSGISMSGATVGAVATISNNLLFSVMSFALGHGAAWLLLK